MRVYLPSARFTCFWHEVNTIQFFSWAALQIKMFVTRWARSIRLQMLRRHSVHIARTQREITKNICSALIHNYTHNNMSGKNCFFFVQTNALYTTLCQSNHLLYLYAHRVWHKTQSNDNLLMEFVFHFCYCYIYLYAEDGFVLFLFVLNP